MALSPEFSISISSDRTTVTITDDTVYGTGGNPARADLRVFVKGYKVDSENTTTEITFTGDDEDPETDSSWEGEYSLDGHWKWHYVAVPVYIAGTYAQYDAVADSTTDAVYRSLVGSNSESDLSNTNYWESIDDPADLAANHEETDESANITSFIYQRILSANAQYAYGNHISDSGSLSDETDSSIMFDYDLMSIWIRNMQVCDQRTEVVDGEVIARRFQARFID
jgi:hypothetical protein